MSARKLGLIVAPDARRDLADILLRSEQRWGKRQRAAYKAALDDTFEELARVPSFGVARDDVSVGLRGRPVRAHVIYYGADEAAVTILRVLHGKMDAARHLAPPWAYCAARRVGKEATEERWPSTCRPRSKRRSNSRS